jgi:hypothetical protein
MVAAAGPPQVAGGGSPRAGFQGGRPALFASWSQAQARLRRASFVRALLERKIRPAGQPRINKVAHAPPHTLTDARTTAHAGRGVPGVGMGREVVGVGMGKCEGPALAAAGVGASWRSGLAAGAASGLLSTAAVSSRASSVSSSSPSSSPDRRIDDDTKPR